MHKFKKIRIGFISSLLFIFFVFRNWFTFSNLSSGDWIFYFPGSVRTLLPFSIWDYGRLGLGGTKYAVFWLESYFGTTIQLSPFMPWVLYERLFWFWPFLILAFSSSYLLSRKIFNSNSFSFLAPIIYSTNTYILLMVGGGQMGIALSYAYVPLVLLSFLKLIYFEEYNLKNSFFFGLLFAILIMLDIRIAFIMALLFIFIIIYVLPASKKILQPVNLLYVIFLPALITIGLHLYWIFPLILSKFSPIENVGKEYTGEASVNFYSFAKMEYALSLLHPNWPENIFGKVNFLNPQFLITPILAFASLLFVRKQEEKIKKIIPLLIFIALIGIFLAKGVNQPIGSVYYWLFNNMPGFQMFRDPTKWYILISISYSLLIPFTINSFSRIEWLKKKNIKEIFLVILFLILWLFLIRDIYKSPKGTFTSHPLPQNYKNFAVKISEDKEFYRILWLPQYHRYGYMSAVHPAVSFKELNTKGNINQFLERNNFKEILGNLSIKYIVVPDDNDKEIFLTDRKYDERERLNLISSLQNSGLKKVDNDFGNLVVFEIPKYKKLFYINNGNLKINRISEVKYIIDIENKTNGNLLTFTDNYDKNWVMNIKGIKIPSTNLNGRNSFILPKLGNQKIIIEYFPQKYVWYAGVISIITLIFVVAVIFLKK